MMQDLIKKIEQWAEDRNIIKGTKPIDQAMKLFSEFGELADNVGKGRDCRDDIGDVFVVLTIIYKQLGKSIQHYKNIDLPAISNIKDELCWLGAGLCGELASDIETELFDGDLDCEVNRLNGIAIHLGYSLEECVQIAYNDIKDRKGIVSNGVFIKESDPVYAQVIAEIEGNYNA